MCKYMKLVADVSPYVTARQRRRSVNQRSASVAMPGTLPNLSGTADQMTRALSENYPNISSGEDFNTSSRKTSNADKLTPESKTEE